MQREQEEVRQHLVREGPERARRSQVITESLRSQIGSEARHLRRLAIGLHGMQMLGGAQWSTRSRDEDEEWLRGVMDELLLLAGQANKNGLKKEVMALRRWLAEDWLRPDTAQDRSQGTSEVRGRQRRRRIGGRGKGGER